MKIKSDVPVIIMVIVQFLCVGFTSLPAQSPINLSEVDEVKLKADLNFLASKDLQGREAGREMGKATAAYLADRMIKAGLSPLVKNESSDFFESYYQNFSIIGAIPGEAHVVLIINSDGAEIQANSGSDFYYFFNSPNDLDFKGEAVFAGYGIRAPEYHYDDLSKLSLKDKLVIAFYGEPLNQDTGAFFYGKHQTHYMMDWWKSRTLADIGAKGLILIPTPENIDKYDKFLQRKMRRVNQRKFVLKEETGVPTIYLSSEFARKIFKQIYDKDYLARKTLLVDWLKSGQKTDFCWELSVPNNTSWLLNIRNKNVEERLCRNVLGICRGNDAKFQDEYILVGAHYDHEGMIGEDIYRGADDNASGVVANINLTEIYGHLNDNEKPKRSIIFAFWDAEEKGTLGSQFFVENSPIPIKKIKTVFNMDMIGRDASFNFAALRQPIKDEDAENKVMIFYSAQVPQLKDMAQKVNDGLNLHILYDPNVYFTSGSDHANFHLNQIPSMFYFTGFHTDYTSVNDTPDKINYEKLGRIIKHLAGFINQLANNNDIPKFDDKILTAPEGDFRM